VVLKPNYELLLFINQFLLIMDRGKIVAIITGAISIIIAVAYLILVALLDSRGQMIPAPIVEFIFSFY